MKDYYSKYTTEYSWLIEEEGWVKSLLGVRESQLALGNGYLGSRAVLEEIPYEARPGTYIAGLYDRVGSKVAELVNLPNPFNFKIAIGGEKLGVATMDLIEHKRILNLRKGLLSRHTVFQDVKKRKYDYQSLRFVSMDNKNIGAMQIAFTPLDDGVEASIQTGIDTSVYNARTVTEGRKKHFRIKEVRQVKNERLLIVETFGKLYTVIFRSGFYYETMGKKVFAEDNIFHLKLRKNQTVVFTKIFYIKAVSEISSLDKAKKSSENEFRKTFKGRFDSLLKGHIKAWKDLWDAAEVSIWDDPEVEKNFRFNIYHMLICAAKDDGASSIGAKALTGEGYRGHIFWDAEIFVFPFYLYTLPDRAKNMLIYRYKRLSAAREISQSYGFKGAMFPWESAGLGQEETPSWAKDLDGKVIRIHTGNMEHHITADIAYAFHCYYIATHDEQFLRDYGYEVLFETARFWASRVEYNRKKKKYGIKNVIGPDEFHTNVNNNAFTNMMAKWNLIIACKMFQKAKKSDSVVLRRLVQKIGLSTKEPLEWKRIAAHITISVNRKQIIEQFDGYFKKKKVKISAWDENSLPVIKEKLSPRDYVKTQFVKQADVVMLLYLLSDVFSSKTKKRNYEYYIKRTLHKSSLSLPIYAIMAVDTGDMSRAYSFFNTALHTDLSNINGNASQGIHAACMGGVYQILISGFAGVKVEKEILSINPKLPKIWRKILFSLQWRGSTIKLEIKRDKIKIRIVSQGKRKSKIKIFGVLHELAANKTYNFERRRHAKEAEAYYL